MIVNYPTALYSSVLPQSASDVGDVTFTISMGFPPKGPLTEVQLPAAVEDRQRTPVDPTPPTGQRIYTNTLSNASIIGSAKKQFEVGQILEFTVAPVSTVQPMLVSNLLEIQHNTNILDLTDLGVSQQDIDAINASANSQFTLLNTQLSTIRQARIDTETAITENQKNQNETNKAISALQQLVPTDPSLQGVLDSLIAKLAELQSQMNALIVAANEQANNAFEVESQIMAVVQMVR